MMLLLLNIRLYCILYCESFIKRSLWCCLYNYNDKDLTLDINIQTESQT